MKTEQIILTTSIQALTDKPNKSLFVSYDGSFAISKSLGVLLDTALTSEQMPVAVAGIALITTGEAISIGDKLVSDANGKALVGTGDAVNGYALDASTGADELIRILLV